MNLQFAPPFSTWQLAAILAGLLVIALLTTRALGKPVVGARRWSFFAFKLLVIGAVVLILLNPVRVRTVDDLPELAEAIVLVDASQSMALPEKQETRWDVALRHERDLSAYVQRQAMARIAPYRFGDRLRSLPTPEQRPGQTTTMSRQTAKPLDKASQLGGALHSLADQLTQRPAAIVVISDGRADDTEQVRAAARTLARLGQPVDVLPVGNSDSQCDVAIHSVILPGQVRKRAEVPVEVLLHSFGCAGRVAEVRIYELDGTGERARELARAEVTLQDGPTTVRLAFAAGMRNQKLLVAVPELEGELSSTNNEFSAELVIDRTKLRVLHLTSRPGNLTPRPRDLRSRAGAQVNSYVQRAMLSDEDAQCVVGIPSGGGLSLLDTELFTLDTRSRLFTYDVILFDGIPRSSFSDELLGWLDEFVSKRGGGVCMIGGPNSFASGGWRGSSLEDLLPIRLDGPGNGWRDSQVRLRISQAHPIWRFAAEVRLNESALERMPVFPGTYLFGDLKPGAQVLATADSEMSPPLFVAQTYGRGRTLAIAPALTDSWARSGADAWEISGESGYDQLWRNVVYWLAEPSTIGRRKLGLSTSKQLYAPGEALTLTAEAFTPEGERTTRYRVLATIEPRTDLAEVHEVDSPFVLDSSTEDEGKAALIPWGEELPLLADEAEGIYRLRLRLAEAARLEAQSALKLLNLRIEATLYDGSSDSTANPGIFLDSAATDVQVLNELPELQNPLPNHSLLEELARDTGGRAAHSVDELAANWRERPNTRRPPTTEQIPLWNSGWLLVALLAMVGTEWVGRRRCGYL